MISQLAAYGVLWIAFPLLAFSAARWGGLRSAIAAHVVVALTIVALDLHWIMNHGLQPAQSGIGLTLAIAVRVCLINVILLPLSLVGIKMRRVGRRPSG
jgi:hypothetical protein